MSAAEPLRLTWRDGALAVDGEIDAAESVGLALALAALEPEGPMTLALEGLELTDGVAVARTVSALRALRDRAGALTLVEAPQMLAHTLYKVGMLGDSLALVSPRSEEGHGAS